MKHLSKSIVAGLNIAGALVASSNGCGKTASALLFVSIVATFATLGSK